MDAKRNQPVPSSGKHTPVLDKEMEVNETSGNRQTPEKFTRAKFWVSGEEIIEKEVKASGNTGRVYLPLDWVGKHVKIIRID